MMDLEAHHKFASDLADSLHSHCQKHLQFDCWIVVTGNLCLQVETGQKIYLNIDQKITKHGKKSAVMSFTVPKNIFEKNTLDEMSAAEKYLAAIDTVNDPSDRNKEEIDLTSAVHSSTETVGKLNCD